MGEEVKKVEEEAMVEQKKEETPAAVPEAEKEEAAAAESKDDEKKTEAAKEQPPPCILGINLHCTGCANKIKRCILRCKGVEGVEVDMAQNQVTVKGGIVDPRGICERLRKRTMRNATVISPNPTEAEASAAAPNPKEEPEPVVVHSQASEVTTVELLVNMHCEACAQQLENKVLKMRSVQSADADFGAGKLTVTGSSMSSDRLVQYIHRRTGKLATVVVPPPPEEEADDGDKKPEEPPTQDADKNDDDQRKQPPAADAVDKKDDAEGENKEAEDGGAEKKDGGYEEAKPELLAVDGFPPEEMMKRMMYWPYPHKHYYNPHAYAMPTMQWTPPPPPPTSVAAPMIYQYYNYGGMVERPAPAPQYFSDENPNACVIS